MFEFAPGQKQLLSNDQLMIIKLTKPRFNNAFYENSFKGGWSSADGKLIRGNAKFLGYMHDYFGLCGFEHEGQYFVAVHKFYQNWDWNETPAHSIKNHWVLMFQGCDDISYYLRFATEDQLDAYWNKTLHFIRDSRMFTYN